MPFFTPNRTPEPRSLHIPILVVVNKRACTVSQTGWIPVYVDHFEAGLHFPLPRLVFDLLADYELALTQLTPNSISFIIGFMLLCARLEVLAKAIVFRNKVVRWKRQFIFVCDTRTERISNDLATRLSEWRTPNTHRENLIDLEALVTSEHLAMFGFVDVTNLFSEEEMSSILKRQRQRAQGSRGRGASSTSQRQTRFDERSPPVPQSRSSSHRGSSSGSRPHHNQRADMAPSARRRVRKETESEDEVPLIRRRTSGGAQPAQAVRLTAARSPNAPSTTARVAAEPASASASVSAPRIAYPDGFSYVKLECQPAMHGEQVAMIKLMDAFSYAVAMFESEQVARSQNNKLSANCKQLAVQKASLTDDVNRLQRLEMANRAAAVESRADELAHRNNELREELERARAEKESGIKAAKEEAAREPQCCRGGAERAEDFSRAFCKYRPSSRGEMVRGFGCVSGCCGGGVCKCDHGDLQRDPWEGAVTSPGLPDWRAGVLRRGGSRRAGEKSCSPC
ncbi:hypothetical protein SLEP1_g9276 [Rubroshorea leprosula]|uniref:Transposase (putative) gypsy type domain-containing protein n=1 Tax=Rubroshorea leprosula TaxID=152421 RepID=A0AAV5IAC2_9ROSI|nr:hypothetical protein SLEP1_g9276 [Rubroshorea leprosula]